MKLIYADTLHQIPNNECNENPFCLIPLAPKQESRDKVKSIKNACRRTAFLYTEFNHSIMLNSGLEIREYGRRDPSRWPHGTLYPQKLALASLTSGGRSRTEAKEFSLVF
jgi:hypothetical protein